MIVLHWTRKIAIFIAGFFVIGIGLILALPGVPGPGILIIIGGLAILAMEFTWAERHLATVRNKFEHLIRRRND